MIEIRIHGRGGQGVVTASELLAIAFFKDGKEVQAFPSFGVERSGAPIQSFVRVSDEQIKTRQHVHEPDILIIQDDTLLEVEGVFVGLKKNSKIVVNSTKSSQEIFNFLKNKKKIIKGFSEKNIISAPASQVALEIFGKNIVNTAMLGILIKIPNLLSIDSVVLAIKERFAGKGDELINKNILAIRKTYNF